MFQVISDGVTGNGYGLKSKKGTVCMKAISDRKRKRGAFCKKSISDGIPGHDYGPKEKVALFARRQFLRASRAMVTGQKKKGNFFFYIKPIFEDVGDIL